MCIAVFASIKNSNLAASRKRIGQEKVHGFPRNQRRGHSGGEGEEGEEEGVPAGRGAWNSEDSKKRKKEEEGGRG